MPTEKQVYDPKKEKSLNLFIPDIIANVRHVRLYRSCDVLIGFYDGAYGGVSRSLEFKFMPLVLHCCVWLRSP